MELNQASRSAMLTEDSRSLQPCGKFLHEEEVPSTILEERERRGEEELKEKKGAVGCVRN